MMKFSKLLLGAVSVVAMSSAAFAADAVIEEVPVVAGYNWSGFYVGVGVGAARNGCRHQWPSTWRHLSGWNRRRRRLRRTDASATTIWYRPVSCSARWRTCTTATSRPGLKVDGLRCFRVRHLWLRSGPARGLSVHPLDARLRARRLRLAEGSSLKSQTLGGPAAASMQIAMAISSASASKPPSPATGP